jgi:hypothetical protein
LRILGLEAASRGDTRAADRLFASAETLSRRDLQTQIWLIEERVRRGDVSGALRHYAVALRVFPEAKTVLFPSLANGVAHPELVDPIADLASSEETWRNAFLTYLMGHAADSLTANFFFAVANRQVRLPADLVGILIPRLIRAGHLHQAVMLYRHVNPKWSNASISEQLDGDFDNPGPAPFGWSVEGQSAYIGPRTKNSGDAALQAVVQPGESVAIARKLIILAPGQRYQITGVYGVPAGEGAVSLRLTLSCAGGADTARDLALDGNQSAFSTELAVPNCAATWLTVAAWPNTDRSVSIWIDKLRLRKAAGG